MESLRDARLRRGYSQSDLADRAGVTQATISRLEAGEYFSRIYHSTVQKLCRALGVKWTHILEFRIDGDAK